VAQAIACDEQSLPSLPRGEGATKNVCAKAAPPPHADSMKIAKRRHNWRVALYLASPIDGIPNDMGDPLVPEERTFGTWPHQLARSILKVEFSPMCTYNPAHSERSEGGLLRSRNVGDHQSPLTGVPEAVCTGDLGACRPRLWTVSHAKWRKLQHHSINAC
jgi:hypothetical protein